MKIKFLADEDLRRSIVLGVRRREPTISFLNGFEVGATGKSDFVVLGIAADENRILVSHDFRTMPQHFRRFIGNRSSPGVFLLPQSLSPGRAVEELVTIWLASEAEEWANHLWYLPL